MNREHLYTVLNDIVSISVDELSILGAILIFVAIFYKLITGIQLVVNILRAIVSERTLPAMVAIGAVSVTIGVAGSGFIFISNSNYPALQAKFILPTLHLFGIELIAVFFISKRPKIKKYSIFIGILIVAILGSTNNYIHLYTLFSLLAFVIAVLQYRRLNSVDRKEYYGTLYLKIALATSFVLCIFVLLNIISNIGTVRITDAILTATVLVIIQYEFYDKMMSEINYI